MHFTNQQLDHRRCFLCAEPVAGPICARCDLHDVRSHKSLRSFVRRLLIHRDLRQMLAGERRVENVKH